MDNKVEINGVTYVRQGADFERQVNQVVDTLGYEMHEALTDVKAIIAGGAVLSAFTQNPINDVDVYFRSKEDMQKAFVAITKDWDSVYLGHTDKSITLKDRETEAIVQFIHFDYFDGAEEVFKAFDFTVCMGAIELGKGEPQLVTHKDFLADVASRTLHFNSGTRFPYISLIRTRKYVERGYKIGKGHTLAIALACAQYPISSWDEAKTQMGGVYGNAIDLNINQDVEFSQEELYKVVTTIKEDLQPIFAIDHDYERAWFDITGTEYGSELAKQFTSAILGEEIKKPTEKVDDIFF